MGNLGLCGQWVQLQEGHGDIIQGLTHILRIWINIGPYVIYMPKIEVWAVETVNEISENQGGAGQSARSRAWIYCFSKWIQYLRMCRWYF